jgi:hypothetical protein
MTAADEKGDTGGLSISPATPVALPSPKSQEMVLVRRSEIHGLKRSAKRAFADPAASASGWAYTWLGIGIAALLSLGALVGVKDQTVSTVVIAGNVIFIIVGFFLAGFLFYFDHKSDKAQETAESDFMAELDELDERAPTTIPDEAQAAT